MMMVVRGNYNGDNGGDDVGQPKEILQHYEAPQVRQMNPIQHIEVFLFEDQPVLGIRGTHRHGDGHRADQEGSSH